MSYSIVYDPSSGRPLILRGDGASIPADSGNADFRAFLVWNAQQPTPLDYTTPNPPTAAQVLAQQRSAAVTLATDPGAMSKLERASLIAIINQTVQQLNLLRANLTTLINAITAPGATLASIQTAAKTIPPMPQIDVNAAIAEVKSDVLNQINNGAAD